MINFSKFNSIYELTPYFNSEDKCHKAIFESRWDESSYYPENPPCLHLISG